jgi:hypothetical protein
MVNITYQNCGNNWVVFLDGDNQTEIEQKYYSLWNWQATSGRLDWLNDKGAKIWTSKERMFRYFKNICLNELIDSGEFKGKKGGALSRAKEMATEKLNEMVKTNDVIKFGKYLEAYSLGMIKAEKPDLELTESLWRNPSLSLVAKNK